MTTPPGNSLDAFQENRVSAAGDDLGAGLLGLLTRVGEEISFNDAKGDAPYRLGIYDALRFAEDAILVLLHEHGYEVESVARASDA